MTFDRARIYKIITEHAARSTEFHTDLKRYPFRIEMEPGYAQNRFKYHAFGVDRFNASNHRRLAYQVFLETVRQDAENIDAWLRKTYPSLDTDEMIFEFEAIKPGGREDKFIFKINGAVEFTRGLGAEELVDRLELMHARLAPIKGPSRQFLVNDAKILADCPTNALRAFLALHHPDLFDVEDPRQHTNLTVSEIHNVSARAAILDPTPKGYFNDPRHRTLQGAAQ